MTTFPRAEVEAAFATFRKLGAEQEDWAAWADLFTDDAHYEEQFVPVVVSNVNKLDQKTKYPIGPEGRIKMHYAIVLSLSS